MLQSLILSGRQDTVHLGMSNTFGTYYFQPCLSSWSYIRQGVNQDNKKEVNLQRATFHTRELIDEGGYLIPWS